MRRLTLFLLLIALLPLVVVEAGIYVLYRRAVTVERERLADVALTHARLIEEVETLLRQRGLSETGLSVQDVVAAAFRRSPGIGETGEFVLGRRDRGDVVFFLSSREDSFAQPVRVPADAETDLPMEAALEGRSGTFVGHDYRGREVLAAYQPLAGLDSGLVVKIDLAEFRDPFLQGGLLAAAMAFAAILLGALVLARYVKPLIEDLEESQAHHRATIETAVDGIITIDERGTIESFNTAATRLFGYRPDEVVGRNVNLLMPSPYREEHDRYITHYLATAERRIIGIGREVVGLRKDGSTFPMDLAVSEMRVRGRRMFTGIVRDITERKRAEEELARLNRILEEKNKELETLIYVTSHDLRSPLVNIQGFSKELQISCKAIHAALEKAGLDEQALREITPILEDAVPEALHYILSGAAKMDTLLAGLLRLSRVGRSTLEVRPLDMNALLASIQTTMEYELKEAGVTVDIDHLPPCRGDEIQLNQVFSNLLGNAVKYRDPSRPARVRVSGELRDGHAIYSVEDNGIGIATDHQQKVFEMFHRLDVSRGDGEGLGLTIAQRIVQRHQGRIWVDSTPGRGTTFHVALPAPAKESKENHE